MADENNAPELGSIFEFSQDIANAEAPPPLPARSYIGTCTGALAKTNKNGAAYGEIKFTIAPDQFPPDFAAVQKDAVDLFYRFVPLTDDTRSRYQLRKFCENMRVSAGKRLDLNDFIGKTATLVVGTSEYQGEKRGEIKSVALA